MTIHDFPYLEDSDFLFQFDRLKVKQQYVKITALDFTTEDPITQINGFATGGNITIDGSSAMRRTANISIITKDFKYSEIDIKKMLSIDKKIQLQVGFKNTTKKYTNYPILWFPQGVYIIMTVNFSSSSAGTSISLGLHDKMALLNGECGGTLPASVTFSQKEDVDQRGNVTIVQPPIYQIIQQAVHHFGGQQIGKIIISDIDDKIKKTMKWMGSTPLYLYQSQAQSGNIAYNYYSTNYKQVSKMLADAKKGTITTYTYGQDVGYILTDFVFPKELIGNAGNTVVTILDQIKAVLGNFEYFYDVFGNFRFQQIKNYLNTSYQQNLIDNINSNSYLVDYTNGKSVYSFSDSEIVQSYTNTPQYQQIKNDFIVWGKRKTVDGNEIPIRYHLSIDSKPKIGNTYKTFSFIDPEDKIRKTKVPIEYENFSDFPLRGAIGMYYLATKTGKIYQWNPIKGYVLTNYTIREITTKDFRTQLYLAGATAEGLGSDTNFYYTQLKNEWPKVYDIQNGYFYLDIQRQPSNTDFFLDLIDSAAAISQFSVNKIGRRTVAIIDESINCIFESNNPDIVLIDMNGEKTNEIIGECKARNQEYCILRSEVYSMLMNGGVLKSAYEQLKTQLYQYTSYNEQISLTVLPIYYFEPNTRITVKDTETGINGDYIIKTISLPLDINGTMTLSCTKALERI